MFFTLIISYHFSSICTMYVIGLKRGREVEIQSSSSMEMQHFNLGILLSGLRKGFTVLVMRFSSPNLNLRCRVERGTPRDLPRARTVLLLLSGIVYVLDRSNSFLFRPTLPFFLFETSTSWPSANYCFASNQILSTVRTLVLNRIATSSLSYS